MRFLILVLINCLTWAGADDHIVVNARQGEILGLKLGQPEAVTAVPLQAVTGRITLPPDAERWVNAPYAGLIEAIKVSSGATVKQGQVLATLVSPQAAHLQQDYLTALGKHRLAAASYRRDQGLFAQGVIAKRRWQETQADYSASQAALKTAEQALLLAGIGAEQVKRLASQGVIEPRLLLTAPIDGVVLTREAHAGQRVERFAPLFHIASLTTLWLEVNVPQELLFTLNPGDRVREARLHLDVPISQIGQSVDAKTQTGWARAVIEAPGNRIKPGQSINGRLWRLVSRGYKVSPGSITSYRGGHYIFVKRDDGFDVIKVAVLGQDDQAHYIQSDALTADSVLVISGATALKAVWLGLGEEE
ncbi:MAG: efflux RND transporter periplasmic adaptor subunit [Methylococcales bacterium]|nr:efflux RND transporter periplasmic adaptor subunit [Methylococcales bacterium]